MSFREIRRALEVLHMDPEEDLLFEVRAPRYPNRRHPDRPFTKSGWFGNDGDGIEDAAIAACDLNTEKKVPAIYVTLNPVRDLDRFTVRGEIGYQPGVTRDADIRYRRWLLVDVDPTRPAGVSATDAEKAAAFDVLGQVREALAGQGFPAPVVADSGNGGHLLYAVRFPNDADTTKRAEFFLKSLAHAFDTEAASVDTTVANAARITKLYGTLSRKGENTAERPHRRSSLLEVPDTIEAVDPALFAEMTDAAFRARPRATVSAPPRRRPSFFTGSHYSGKEFDLLDLLGRAGIDYTEGSKDGATVYHLRECPIDSTHEKGQTDTTIFVDAGGRLGFKCLHNRCQGHDWRSARQHLEAMAR